MVAAALVWATMPAAPARAETGDDSIGAAVAVGLLVAVVVVYGLVSLRSDVERYSAGGQGIRHRPRLEDGGGIPIVLQTISAPIGLNSQGAGRQTEIAGAGIGWRTSF